MSTFAGRYIKEPSDLSTVASESKQIKAFCDGQQVSALAFAGLTGPQLAIAMAVANPLIAAAESEIESYAAKRGYGIPLSPVDASVIDLIAQWVWIGALQRGGTLTIVDAQKQRDAMRAGSLADIADGKLILTAIVPSNAPAPDANVYRISDAPSRSQGTVERTSRTTLRGF